MRDLYKTSRCYFLGRTSAQRERLEGEREEQGRERKETERKGEGKGRRGREKTLFMSKGWVMNRRNHSTLITVWVTLKTDKLRKISGRILSAFCTIAGKNLPALNFPKSFENLCTLIEQNVATFSRTCGMWSFLRISSPRWYLGLRTAIRPFLFPFHEFASGVANL